MKLSDVYQHTGLWMDGSGPKSDVVISSRIRLARNIDGFLFYSHASTEQRSELLDFIHGRILETDLRDRIWYVDIQQAGPLERQILKERQLISKQLAEGDGSRGVAISHDESLSVMINEEDHLRIQMLASGLQLHETYDQIYRVETILEEKMDYAFSPQYGYLTACPTNVGTGIRVSVMLHLPALKMTGQIEKVFQAAKDMSLTVRGLFGEGSEPIGDFFQLSNQTTLGKTEKQIMDELIRYAINPVVEYERIARQRLVKDKLTALDDKVYRSLGLLTNARMISTEESLFLLSYLRLGVQLGRIKNLNLETINELFILTQPAHLQNLQHRSLESSERDIARADFIRDRLK